MLSLFRFKERHELNKKELSESAKEHICRWARTLGTPQPTGQKTHKSKSQREFTVKRKRSRELKRTTYNLHNPEELRRSPLDQTLIVVSPCERQAVLMILYNMG